MRIISITNQKGGCGKTTTAVNLAASLSVNNRKVLLIDLDPQAHATLGLNVKSNLSIYNVLSKITNKKAKLEDIIQNLDTNFDLTPSSVILSTIEQELAGEIGRESRLRETLSSFKANYDYVIIDCPPNLGILTINAIRASHEIIVPVEASRFSLEGLSQLLDIVNLIRDRLNHNVAHKILVTNFDSRLRHSFKILDKIKWTFKDQLFSNIIHVNVKLKEAQSQGMHILSYDKYSRGAKDYFSLAREIITQEKTPAPSIKLPVKITEKVISRPIEKIILKPEIMQEKLIAALKEDFPQLSEIIFSLTAPDAKEVYIVGDFNDWRIDDSSRMNKDRDGWKKRLNLETGKYRYRFVIDGNWTDDPVNPIKELNPYGQTDSLIEINPK